MADLLQAVCGGVAPVAFAVLTKILAEEPGSDYFFIRRRRWVTTDVDLQYCPISPAGEEEVIKLIQLRFAEGVAAVEDDVMVLTSGERIGSDEGGDMIGRCVF